MPPVKTLIWIMSAARRGKELLALEAKLHNP